MGETIIGVILAVVLASALGMGLAWWLIFELRFAKSQAELYGMLDYYDKRAREADLEIWALRRHVADLKGEKFTDQKPELTYNRYPWRDGR